MELSLLIILVAIGYWIWKSIQQNSPESKIDRLESSAEGFYPAVLKEAEEDVKKWEKELGSVKKVVFKKESKSPMPRVIPERIEYRSESGTEKEKIVKILQKVRTRLKEIREFNDNYLRLKERYKLDSGEVRLALAQDYFDYYYTRKQINSEFDWLNYADNKWADEIFEEMRTLEIRAEEIVKRVTKKVTV